MVEKACLPDLLDRLSAKEHIAATFRPTEPISKDCQATCVEAQEANAGKQWPCKCTHLCVSGSPRHTHQHQLVFTDCYSELESDLALEVHICRVSISVLIRCHPN